MDPGLEKPTTLTGISIQGHFDVGGGNTALVGAKLADGLFDNLTVTITNDPACDMSSVLRVEIDVKYPGPIGSATGLLHSMEWVEYDFTFTPGFKTPRVAWAGTTVTTVFALGGNCDAFDGHAVYFTRAANQNGTFVPSGGVTVNGPDSASGFLDDECSIAVGYHTERPW